MALQFECCSVGAFSFPLWVNVSLVMMPTKLVVIQCHCSHIPFLGKFVDFAAKVIIEVFGCCMQTWITVITPSQWCVLGSQKRALHKLASATALNAPWLHTLLTIFFAPQCPNCSSNTSFDLIVTFIHKLRKMWEVLCNYFFYFTQIVNTKLF